MVDNLLLSAHSFGFGEIIDQGKGLLCHSSMSMSRGQVVNNHVIITPHMKCATPAAAAI